MRGRTFAHGRGRTGMMPTEDVGSRRWWEACFVRHRDSGGAVLRRVLDHLPAEARCHLGERSLDLLHWGCGGGEGLAELARRYPAAGLAGADWCDNALAAAR